MKRSPCPGLWMTPVVRHDGQLLVCCADVQGRIAVGNLRDASFRELWEGERMREYRRWHVRGEFERMPVCAACGGINFYKLTPEQVREWCELNGEQEAWEAYRQRMGIEE
jgi:radical SAM protein with 4Fe4S-binding SPASM domain